MICSGPHREARLRWMVYYGKNGRNSWTGPGGREWLEGRLGKGRGWRIEVWDNLGMGGSVPGFGWLETT